MLDNEKTPLKLEFPHAADAYLRGSQGLGGGAAKAFADVARGFSSDVEVRWDGHIVDGKSAVNLARLNIAEGQVIRIMTRGADAEAALTALERAVMLGLEADEDPFEAEALESLEDASDVRRGSPAAAGLAIAAAFVWQPPEISVSGLSEGYPKERNKLLSALIVARQELQKLIGEVTSLSGSLLAPIFAEQLGLLDDPDLLEETDKALRQGLSAREAFASVMQRQGSAFDVEVRVMNILGGYSSNARIKSLPPNPIILVCQTLSPSDYILLDPERVAGVVMEADLGPTIAGRLMKSRGIPCVAKLGAMDHPIRTGIPLIVDGDSGLVVVKPNAHSYKTARTLMRSRIQKNMRPAPEPSRTKAPIFNEESIEHFSQAAKLAANLEIPASDLRFDPIVHRAGAARDLRDDLLIDRPGPSESGAKGGKKTMWDRLLGRK